MATTGGQESIRHALWRLGGGGSGDSRTGIDLAGAERQDIVGQLNERLPFWRRRRGRRIEMRSRDAMNATHKRAAE